MGAGNTPSEGRTSGCATLRGQSLDSSPHSTLQKAVRGSPGDNIHRVCPAWASGSKQIASALPGRDTYRDYVMGRVPDRSEALWRGGSWRSQCWFCHSTASFPCGMQQKHVSQPNVGPGEYVAHVALCSVL